MILEAHLSLLGYQNERVFLTQKNQNERVALLFFFPERTAPERTSPISFSLFFEKTKNGIHRPPHHHLMVIIC